MLIGLDGGMRSTESTEPKASLGGTKITHPALLQGGNVGVDKSQCSMRVVERVGTP